MCKQRAVCVCFMLPSRGASGRERAGLCCRANVEGEALGGDFVGAFRCAHQAVRAQLGTRPSSRGRNVIAGEHVSRRRFPAMPMRARPIFVVSAALRRGQAGEIYLMSEASAYSAPKGVGPRGMGLNRPETSCAWRPELKRCRELSRAFMSVCRAAINSCAHLQHPAPASNNPSKNIYLVWYGSWR